MATTDEMTAAHITVALRTLWITFDRMPETAVRWSGLDEDERFDFAIEWPDTMWRFEGVSKAEVAGKLTAEQQACYERLVHRYEEVLPIIQQLGLQTIPVPKLHSRR